MEMDAMPLNNSLTKITEEAKICFYLPVGFSLLYKEDRDFFIFADTFLAPSA